MSLKDEFKKQVAAMSDWNKLFYSPSERKFWNMQKRDMVPVPRDWEQAEEIILAADEKHAAKIEADTAEAAEKARNNWAAGFSVPGKPGVMVSTPKGKRGKTDSGSIAAKND